jgi:Tfp pilus assembly protein PilE
MKQRFTIIEVLIAVALISVLVGVFVTALIKAKRKVARSDILGDRMSATQWMTYAKRYDQENGESYEDYVKRLYTAHVSRTTQVSRKKIKALLVHNTQPFNIRFSIYLDGLVKKYKEAIAAEEKAAAEELAAAEEYFEKSKVRYLSLEPVTITTPVISSGTFTVRINPPEEEKKPTKSKGIYFDRDLGTMEVRLRKIE